MGMMINRRRVMGGSLPYDAEIEYLEGTGTQWIDTGIVPNETTDFSLTAVFNVRNNNTCLFSASTNWGWSQYTAFRNPALQGFYWAVMGGSSKGKVTCDATVKHIYRTVGANLYLDGVQEKTQTWNSGFVNTTLKIFAHGSKSRFSLAKVYGLTLKQQETLLLDMIPVRIGQVGYMYDKVSGQLFGNAGTGAFILGPDK